MTLQTNLKFSDPDFRGSHSHHLQCQETSPLSFSCVKEKNTQNRDTMTRESNHMRADVSSSTYQSYRNRSVTSRQNKPLPAKRPVSHPLTPSSVNRPSARVQAGNNSINSFVWNTIFTPLSIFGFYLGISSFWSNKWCFVLVLTPSVSEGQMRGCILNSQGEEVWRKQEDLSSSSQSTLP